VGQIKTVIQRIRAGRGKTALTLTQNVAGKESNSQTFRRFMDL